MKIGTLTFFRSNYGAILQAYALQRVLTAMGHSPVLLDYEAAPGRDNSVFASMTSAKNIVLNLFTVLRYGNFARRRKKIFAFRARHLAVSDQKYTSSERLRDALSEYQALLCGSDQVWRPTLDSDAMCAYQLGFATREEIVKLSYAPSFGVSSISPSRGEKMRPWIDDIPNLSVREDAGGAIIEELTGRKAATVLDPTLLLEKEEWNRIAIPPNIDTPYILVYTTSQRGLFPELLSHIKKTTRLPVVVLSLTSLNLLFQADRVIYDAGPGEFVGLFANARCVCTNSFHGTAFSIIYGKPFWTIPHNATNSRIAGLLHRIAFQDRQVSTRDTFPDSPLDIEYATPATLLSKEKQRSLGFLQTALQNP